MIKVNDTYYINVDALNYTALRDTGKVSKAGDEIYKTIGYYSDILGALKGIGDDMVRRNLLDVNMELPQAIEEIGKTYGQLADTINGVYAELDAILSR